ERVAHELERGRLVEVLDGEDGLEDGLQALVPALVGGRLPLEELVVRTLLDVDQIRNVDDLLDAAEAPPEAEVVRHARRRRHALTHRCSCRMSGVLMAAVNAMIVDRPGTT